MTKTQEAVMAKTYFFKLNHWAKKLRRELGNIHSRLIMVAVMILMDNGKIEKRHINEDTGEITVTTGVFRQVIDIINQHRDNSYPCLRVLLRTKGRINGFSIINGKTINMATANQTLDRAWGMFNFATIGENWEPIIKKALEARKIAEEIAGTAILDRRDKKKTAFKELRNIERFINAISLSKVGHVGMKVHLQALQKIREDLEDADISTEVASFSREARKIKINTVETVDEVIRQKILALRNNAKTKDILTQVWKLAPEKRNKQLLNILKKVEGVKEVLAA